MTLSLGFGALVLVPKVAVSSDAPLDPRDPLSTPFIVSNDGYLPIKQVSASCYFHSSDYKRSGHFTSFTTLTYPALPDILGGDKQAVTCWPAVSTNDPRFGDELINADISVFVDYRVDYWWGRRTKEARFVTAKDAAAGHLRWLPRRVG